MTRTTFIMGFAAGTVALAVACSSSTENTSSSSGGTPGTSSGTSSGTTSSSGASGNGNNSNFKNCSTESSSTCTDAEIKPYADCLNEKCDAKWQECYGPSYKSGTFGGPCGSYITCTQKCDCKDTACYAACKPDDACTTCITGAASCGESCTAPACASASSSSSGGNPNATCATLQTCCDAIADDDQKQGCQQAKDGANGDDATCGQYYNGFKAAGLCP